MQFKIFKDQNIVQGISEVSFGSITGKKKRERAVKFLKSLGYKVGVKNLIWAEQVFDSKVHICQKKDLGKIIRGVDGLVSNIPGQILTILLADCVPLLLFDPRNKVVAALHGSRKSLVGGIIKTAIRKMILNFGSKPKEILVGVGPHIRKCHYFIDKKIYQQFKNSRFEKYLCQKKENITRNKSGRKKVFFDLTKLIFDDLSSLGIKRRNIEDCRICTFCSHKMYFSRRKQRLNYGIYREKKSCFAGFIGLEKQKIFELSGYHFDSIIKQLVKALKNGEVIVCPTDTVYGLISDATNKKAVEKIFKIKKRSIQKPIPLFIKDIKMAKKLAFVNKEQEKFLKKVWPGKVTVVFERKKIKRLYGLDKSTIALRIPNYPFLNKLLKKINKPLTATSANLSGFPASTKIKEVLRQFQNKFCQPDIVLDAGNLPRNRPSKIIDLTGEKPKILRK